MPELHPTTDAVQPPPVDELTGLLYAVRRKERQAFEALYDSTVQRVYSLALRITQQHEMAEEVVSDVYLQVWQQAERFDAVRGNVMAWLTVLCRSRALDMLRRNKSSVIHEAVNDAQMPEVADPVHPQDLLMAVEQQSALHDALAQLDEQQRQLLALAYFRGYSHSELAQFTGLPLGTVKTQLRRTLITLKNRMCGTGESLGEA